MPDDLNRTTIVLIPKTRNPREMKEFRPISLCNVLYKICSKVIAMRMREFLDDIISEEQSAFVPGRLISEDSISFGDWIALRSFCFKRRRFLLQILYILIINKGNEGYNAGVSSAVPHASSTGHGSEGMAGMSELLDREAVATTNFAGERSLAGGGEERENRETLVGPMKG